MTDLKQLNDTPCDLWREGRRRVLESQVLPQEPQKQEQGGNDMKPPVANQQQACLACLALT